MTVQNSLLDGLVQRLGGTANAAAIFGAPVERGDITVIPVAKAAFAFGGGSGTQERRRWVRGRWWGPGGPRRVHRDSTRGRSL